MRRPRFLFSFFGSRQAATAVAAVAAQIGVSPASASAASGSGKGLPASGYFVQHAVFKVWATHVYCTVLYCTVPFFFPLCSLWQKLHGDNQEGI